MKDFKSWLRLPWTIKKLDRDDSLQISRNLEQFLHFGNFLHKKQSFPPYVLRHVALTFARGIQITKNLHF